jgi:hypothetical protein
MADFLIERPMLASCAPDSTVLLIDEVTVLTRVRGVPARIPLRLPISIPSAARCAPPSVLSSYDSNRTRDLHGRRDAAAAILDRLSDRRSGSAHDDAASTSPVDRARRCRRGGKQARAAQQGPGIAEAVDWAEAATLLHERGARWPDAFKRSIGVALKDEEDLTFISGWLDALIAEAAA